MSEQSEILEDPANSEQDLKEIIANLFLANENLKRKVARTEALEERLSNALKRVSELEDALRMLGSSGVGSVTEVRKIVVACLKTPHASDPDNSEGAPS